MRKMKIETIIANLEKVQRDVHSHDFDFGKAVSESTTEEHAKVEEIDDILNDIHDNFVDKEKAAAQEEMLALVKEVFEKVDGDPAKARELLASVVGGNNEGNSTETDETSDDVQGVAGSDSYPY